MIIWTVYFNPKDFPNLFVARKFDTLNATDDFMVSNSLKDIRDFMQSMGLHPLPRHQQDDSVIVETWI